MPSFPPEPGAVRPAGRALLALAGVLAALVRCEQARPALGRRAGRERPQPGRGDEPLTEPQLFVCCQLYGTVADCDLRVVPVEVLADEDGAETERPVKQWEPWPVPLTDLELVETHGLLLRRVPFDGPGVYEFRLRADGFDAPRGAERVAVPHVIRESP